MNFEDLEGGLFVLLHEASGSSLSVSEARKKVLSTYKVDSVVPKQLLRESKFMTH